MHCEIRECQAKILERCNNPCKNSQDDANRKMPCERKDYSREERKENIRWDVFLRKTCIYTKKM